SRRFAILGDEGINRVVPENFWEDVKDLMAERFREGDFGGGMVQGIARVGEKLHEFFPWQSDDVNELSDEISFGGEAGGTGGTGGEAEEKGEEGAPASPADAE
ncbi:MAG: TPM domain-containing protein, partial [Nitrospinota bacterium]